MGDYGMIELILVFGGILAFAVWELMRTRRALRDGAPRKPGGEGPSPEG